ncbi:unnamed protein product [Mytilus edulis]|uniref:Uncharacterized protein n=1 Tax=Mytilus edulis TaxID=6550 RepID=A0A8S3TT17_MYTED|nr:unnamed protein product [Mytilus edulis]
MYRESGYNGYMHGEVGLQWLHTWESQVTMVTCMGKSGYNGYMHGESGYNGYIHGESGYNGYIHGEFGYNGYMHGEIGYNGYMHGEIGYNGYMHGEFGYNGYMHGEIGYNGYMYGKIRLQWLHAWRIRLQWLHTCLGNQVTMVTFIGKSGYNVDKTLNYSKECSQAKCDSVIGLDMNINKVLLLREFNNLTKLVLRLLCYT